MNCKKMIENGWIEKKEFWMRRGEYGTWIANMELGYVPKKKNRKKAGNFKVIDYDRSKLFDENGMLILPGGRK